MSNKKFTLDDLKRILIASAGEAEGIDLDGDILDASFVDLGYESVAMLELNRKIQIEFKVKLDDVEFIEAETPRALLLLVNTACEESLAAHSG